VLAGPQPKGALELVIDTPAKQTHTLAYALSCDAAAR
jgi:hypothetical protein